MTTRRRLLVVALLGLLAAPVAAMLWFDATWFYPRLSAVRSKVQVASPEERTPDRRLSMYIDAAEGDVSHQVARLISIQPGPEPSPLSQGQWNRYGLASNFLVWVHCGESEQHAIYASLIYVGPYGHGLQSASRGMYSRDLSTLDSDQLARVVSYPFAPLWMQEHPEMLDRRARLVKKRLRP